jgi:AhpD family alkylhydroperoxidase
VDRGAAGPTEDPEPSEPSARRARHPGAGVPACTMEPARMKELVALAVAITRECDGCISAHARGAARRGATLAEVTEMIGVAIVMNAGPSTVWGPRALAAFHEFADPPA